MTTLADIETRCAAYRGAHDALAEQLQALEDAVIELKRASLPAIREVYADLAAEEILLRDDLDHAKALFERPRTRVLHGLKVGWQKGKARLEWDDPARVTRLIGQHLPEQAAGLIRTTSAPIKKALEALDAKTLKKLGVRIAGGEDSPLIKAVDSGVNRLINTLLGDFRRELEAGRTERKKAA